jgi:hypothetical protein
MRQLTRPFLFTLLLTCLASAQSKDFWEKRDYRQWTDKECRKLLEESPWATSYTMSQIFFDRVVTDTTDRERQQNPKIEYKIQIRSALPIKKGIVRLSQINAKYDQMTEDQRKTFDQNAEKFLAGRNPDSVVIHVAYSASAQLDDRDLTHYWHTQTTESLKNFTYLIGGGSSRVPLSVFRPGNGEAHEFQFVFPREYNGRPVIGPGDKVLSLEFNHPDIRGPAARILIQFKVEKMISQGTVIY